MYYVYSTNPDAPSSNLQNIKDEHDDQAAREKLRHSTSVEPRASRQLIFENVYTAHARYFIQCYTAHYVVQKC
jgi:hypothetical protein